MFDHVTIRVSDRAASELFYSTFPVDDDEAVDAFHRAAVAAGFRDNGPPGERPVYHHR